MTGAAMNERQLSLLEITLRCVLACIGAGLLATAIFVTLVLMLVHT